MKNKLYLRVNSAQHGDGVIRHILYRVDEIKEFAEIIESKEAKMYFTALEGLVALGNKPKQEPYRIEVESTVFKALVSKIDKKIGSGRKLNTTTLNIVKSSNHNPCIVITKSEEV